MPVADKGSSNPEVPILSFVHLKNTENENIAHLCLVYTSFGLWREHLQGSEEALHCLFTAYFNPLNLAQMLELQGAPI